MPTLFEPARFFRQHDRYAVADRIGELGLTRNQFVAFGVIFERPLCQRADENFQQFRMDAIRRRFGRRDGGDEGLTFISIWSLFIVLLWCNEMLTSLYYHLVKS